MKRAKSSRKKKEVNRSFYMPYLASLEMLAAKQPSSPTIKNKQKERYKNLAKGSKQNLLKTYLPTKDLRERLLSKRRPVTVESKVPRESIQLLNASLAQHRKSFTLQRRFTQAHMQKRVPESVKKLQIKSHKQQAKRTPKMDSKNESFQKQIVFTQPFSVISEFQIPGVQFKSTYVQNQTRQIPLVFKLSNPNYLTNSTKLKSSVVRVKQSQNWQRQRRINIDSIINRKCKNFQDTILEYYRRMPSKQVKMVFTFNSNDTWIKKILLKRGWIENRSKQSRAFHLLWTFKFPKEVPFGQQMVNHYPKSYKVTIKSGLHRLLKMYRIQHLQPRTYDIDSQRKEVISQYNTIFFSSFLSQFLCSFQEGQQIKMCEKDMICEINKCLQEKVQNQQEETLTIQLRYLLTKCMVIINRQDFHVDMSRLLNFQKYVNKYNSFKQIHQGMVAILFKFIRFLKEQRLVANWKGGEGSGNIWIVKSKSSSKGAGIFLTDSLPTLLKQNNRLIQKYIQNVLILKCTNNRKFDIRLWVLLVGSQQAKMYYYHDFYGRVCAEPYRVTRDSLKNEDIHLTNYAVNRGNFKNNNRVNQSVLFPQNLFLEVSERYKLDFEALFYDKVQRMLNSLLVMLKQEISMNASNKYFQLFGFDLLLDRDLNLHLLEVNLSAKCEQRHQRLSAMLQEMGQGLLNIVQDRMNKTQWVLIE